MFRDGGADVRRCFGDHNSVIVGLLHEEEQKDKDEGEEDGGPVKYPSPALVLGDEAAYYGRKVVTARESERVDSHVGTALMSKVLEEY